MLWFQFGNLFSKYLIKDLSNIVVSYCIYKIVDSGILSNFDCCFERLKLKESIRNFNYIDITKTPKGEKIFLSDIVGFDLKTSEIYYVSKVYNNKFLSISNFSFIESISSMDNKPVKYIIITKLESKLYIYFYAYLIKYNYFHIDEFMYLYVSKNINSLIENFIPTEVVEDFDKFQNDLQKVSNK